VDQFLTNIAREWLVSRSSVSPSLYGFVREQRGVSLHCTYTGQRCRDERPAVSVPVRSGPAARDSVASYVTGNGRLPDKLDCDVGIGDDERIAQMLRCARRPLNYQYTLIDYLTHLLTNQSINPAGCKTP